MASMATYVYQASQRSGTAEIDSTGFLLGLSVCEGGHLDGPVGAYLPALKDQRPRLLGVCVVS